MEQTEHIPSDVNGFPGCLPVRAQRLKPPSHHILKRKTRWMGASGWSKTESWEGLPVLLNACCAQAWQAELIDCFLPGQKFFNSERVALTSFFQREQTAAHGGDDLRLAANDPPFRGWGREVPQGEWRAVRSDDVSIRIGGRRSSVSNDSHESTSPRKRNFVVLELKRALLKNG